MSDDLVYKVWLMCKIFHYEMSPKFRQLHFKKKNDPHQEIKMKAKEQALLKFYTTQYLTELYTQQPKKWASNLLHVTINPDPKKWDGPMPLLDKWTLLSQQPQLRDTCYMLMVIEQRTQYPEPYSGYHSHIILQRHKTTTNNGLAKVKKIFTDIYLNMNVYFTYPPAEHLERICNYLLGEKDYKKKPDKEAKQKNDVFMREHYGLEKFYTSSSSSSNYLIKNQKKNEEEDIDIDVLPT